MKKEHYSVDDDLLLKSIKQKMENHSLPVSEDVWEGIAQSLKPQKRVIPLWGYASVAVAAGLALLLSLGNFFNISQENTLETTVQTAQNLDEVQELNEPDVQTIPQKTPQSATPQLASADPKVVSKKLSEPSFTSTSASTSTEKDEQESKPNIELNILHEPMQEVAQTSVDEGPIDDVQVATITEEKPNKTSNLNQTLTLEHPDWTAKMPQKKKRKMLLAAAFGSGVGSSSATITPRSRAYRNQSLADIETTVGRVLTPNDFRQKEYMPPISTSLNLRMPFSNHVSFESGVVYNYLQTRLSGSVTGDDDRASIDLHYVGIPANLVASLFNNKKWDLYVSAGPMLEKGLRSDFRQFQDIDHTRVKTVASTEVNGLQWSLNSAVGVGYAVMDQVSLFFDPQLSYYFESEQPYSIRKELPLVISLHAGLRVSL